MSTTISTPLPVAAAVVTTNTAPAIGKITYYNASGGSLTPPMPAYSALNVGARFAVRRDPADVSGNSIRFTASSGDTFYGSGATTFDLPVSAEQREYQVIQPGGAGSKYWAPAGSLNPLVGLDKRYADRARQPVQIANNCVAAPNSTGTFSGTYRWFYTVGIAACDLQLVFINWTDNNSSPQVDADPATSLTFTAAIEDASGVVFPLTSGGARTMTMGPGAKLVTDPLPIEVAVGDIIWVRIFISSGTAQINRCYIGYTTGGGVTGATDLTGYGAAAVADINTGVFSNSAGPAAILGKPLSTAVLPKSLIQFGDSIGAGITDGPLGSVGGYFTAKPYLCGGGFTNRLMNGTGGLINLAIASDRLYWFNANAGHWKRGQMAQYAKFAFIQYGANDLFAGQTVAQLQQSILTLAVRNLARGIVKNFVATLMPRTSSTDIFTTTTNQTQITTGGMDVSRVTHNNWVRAGCPVNPTTLAAVTVGTSGALLSGQAGHPIAGWIEIADVVESARDSGLWKVPAGMRTVTDCSATSGSATITSATAAFTSADVGAGVQIAGAGSAGALYTNNVIFSVTNSTTAVLAFSASFWPLTTVTNARLVLNGITADGTHPSGGLVGGHTIVAADSRVGAALLAMMN